MAKPNFRDLPEELVSNISLRLWSDDVQALRLTCKALEAKTLHDFATEYFSEKGIVISGGSLKVLIAIANNAKLRGFLRRIHIITAYFSESAFTCGKACPYGHCCGWQATIRQREAWKFLVQDAKDLKTTGRDKEMLTEAFSKLSSLNDIMVVDTTSAVPVSVDICMMRKVARLCGRNFQVACDSKSDSEYPKVLSHVWSILTTAIANSGITTLKSFGTSLGKGHDALCIPLDIRFSDVKIGLLKTALKTVETFGLQMTTRLRRNASGVEKQTMMKASPQRVQRFASVLPALQSLDLEFDGSSTDGVIFNNLTLHLDLSMLKKLQLRTLVISRQSLMAAFERLTSIQDLYLSFVDLSKGSWIPVLKQLQGMDNHLEHLHLMYLLENGKKAYFLAQPDEDEQMDQEDMLFDDFLGMGEPEEDLDDDDDTDEDLLPLETMDRDVVDADSRRLPSTAPMPATDEDENVPSQTGPATVNSSSSTADIKPANHQTPKSGSSDYHASVDYKAPGNESFHERGYYVCIRGKEEINKQLKTFAQEYNLGEDVGAHGPPPGAVGGVMGGAMTIPVPVGGPPGQPPNMNNILNGLAGYLGLPPMPGQNGGGAGPGPGAGGHHGGGAHAGAQQGAANGNNTNATGGQQAAANNTNGTNGTAMQNSTSQGAGGQMQGAAHGHLFTSQNSADFMMIPPPAFAGGGATHGASMDYEWDTEEEESSEFASEAEE